MEEGLIVICERDAGAYCLGNRAFPSQEEAAGAAVADMRRLGMAQKESLNRLINLAELNVGAIHFVRSVRATYRIVYAHRMADGKLALPRLRVKTDAGRPGTIMDRQFIAVSSAWSRPEGPGWVGGKDGWLFVEWDDGGTREELYPTRKQVQASSLRSLVEVR